LQWEKNDPEALAAVIPPYPYGPTLLYKQSRTGLYGGKKITYGNNVGDKIEVKTRRSFKPNIFTRRIYSKALERTVQLRVSSRVLRTIDKLGGVDNYLLGEKEQRIKELGESGWWLRWAIMQTPSIKKRFAAQRQQMGLPKIEETVAELVPEAEVDETNSETLSSDDAFTVVASPNKPKIKFRVGHGQHIYLTEHGWKRTRPDPQRWIDAAKTKIKEANHANYVDKYTEAFATKLTLKNAETPEEEKMTSEEIAYVMKAARRRIRQRLDEQLQLEYNRAQESRQTKRVKIAKNKAAVERKQKAEEADSNDIMKIAGFNYVLPSGAENAPPLEAEEGAEAEKLLPSEAEKGAEASADVV
jgi:large subunit ribosomal protein L28